MPDFSAVLADHTGAVVCDIRAPETVMFTRNAAASISIPLDIEEDAARQLVDLLANGIPRLKLYQRFDGDISGTLIANAPWQPMQEGGEDESTGLGQLQGSFRSPFAILESRYTNGAVTPTGDAGAIAWGLINTTNTDDRPTGLRSGAIEATVPRTPTYTDAQISQSIIDLTTLDGGFDFEDVPVDEGAVCGAFTVHAHQGTDATGAATWEYGPGTVGNVLNATRQTQPPRNRVRVIGANGLRAEAFDAASIAKYGTFMPPPVQASDVTDQPTLDARAKSLLRPNPIKVISFKPDPSGPQPRRDFWLGDVVSFHADYGSFQETLTPRVNSIAYTIDQEGNMTDLAVTIDQDVGLGG